MSKVSMHPTALSLFIIAIFALCFGGRGEAETPNGLILLNPDGGEVRSLIIGIDAYQHVRQLKGAVADARDLEQSLRKMGTHDVTSLIDLDANRVRVLQAIDNLIRRTQKNDLVVLSIAGHGAQEPEHIKGSEPDGLENVFLLPDFATTAEGSKQRLLGSEFNYFIRQFELKGAKVLFIADTCHGGGMTREIDPRAGEMSFRQVPKYTLSVDTLKRVGDQTDSVSDLDLDRTTFLAAVDRSTKAPEVQIPGVSGFRGALSYALARAFEGNADADHDGKITLKELFANVRQVVYQLSDQRQNIVTKTSPGRSVETDVVFQLTRGLSLGPPAINPTEAGATSPTPRTGALESPVAAPLAGSGTAGSRDPIRLASLDGTSSYFSELKSRESSIQIVRPVDNPDLIWDPSTHDVIAWGDVVAYSVDRSELVTVIDRTNAVRELKRYSTTAPQTIRVAPSDARHRNEQRIRIELSDMAARSLILFDISGDGTIQILYPIGSDAPSVKTDKISIPVRVRQPFGADQVVAISSAGPQTELLQALAQMDRRRTPGLLVKTMLRYLPPDARVGSIGFYTAP